MKPTRVAQLTLTAPRFAEIALFDASTGIKLTPLRITIHEENQTLFFPNLWRGNFTVNINDENINFEILKTETKDLSKDITIKANISIGFRTNAKAPGNLSNKYISYLNNLGWNKTLRNCDELTAVCEYLSNESQKEIGRKATIIPTPVPGPISKPKDLKLKHPSACLIQNHQIKQKSEALLQFIEVIKETPQITYYISRGLPENQNNINHQKVIENLKQLKNVILVDINHQNKFDYLFSADIYVLASGLDCTPATIIEAYLSGKPVIASLVGGIPEMIINGETGWCLENGDTESWVGKIDELINSRGKLREMGHNGKVLAEDKYCFSKIAKQIYKEINEPSI